MQVAAAYRRDGGSKRHLEPTASMPAAPGPKRLAVPGPATHAPVYYDPEQQDMVWDGTLAGGRALIRDQLDMDCTVAGWPGRPGQRLFEDGTIKEVETVEISNRLIEYLYPDFTGMMMLIPEHFEKNLPKCPLQNCEQIPPGCNSELLGIHKDVQVQCSAGMLRGFPKLKIGQVRWIVPSVVTIIEENVKAINRAQLRGDLEAGLTQCAVSTLGHLQQRARFGPTAAANSSEFVQDVIMDHVVGMAHLSLMVCNMFNMLYIIEEEKEAAAAAAAGAQ